MMYVSGNKHKYTYGSFIFLRNLKQVSFPHSFTSVSHKVSHTCFTPVSHHFDGALVSDGVSHPAQQEFHIAVEKHYFAVLVLRARLHTNVIQVDIWECFFAEPRFPACET